VFEKYLRQRPSPKKHGKTFFDAGRESYLKVVIADKNECNQKKENIGGNGGAMISDQNGKPFLFNKECEDESSGIQPNGVSLPDDEADLRYACNGQSSSS